MYQLDQMINIPQYINKYISGLSKGKILSSGEISMNCPFHEDGRSSFSINPTTGLWKCYVADCKGFHGGNLIQFVSLAENISTKDAYNKILEESGYKKEPKKPIQKELCSEKINEYHLALLGEEKVLQVLYSKYKYNGETITKFKLGWNGSRLTIPIYDHTGSLVNIRKKPLDGGNCIGVEFYNEMRLFPLQNLAEKTIYLFEGEKDCILACQLGLNAMTVTGGAGSFRQEWITLFKDKNVYVCYDIDKAGMAGTKRIKDILLNAVEEFKIIKLPIKSPKNGDFTDFILQDGTKKKFLELVNNTAAEAKLINQNVRVPTYVYPTDLGSAAGANFFFRRVRFNVIVSGKDTQPYLPPREIDITCPADQTACKHCGMAQYGGNFTLKLNELSQDILQWIDCTEDHHAMLIRKNLEIPMKCKIWKSFSSRAQTLEEITLIPEISYAAHETEYVVRTAYVIGKIIKTNCNYQLEAITMPHPRTQYATHLIYRIAENKTNIDQFKIDEKMKKELEVFKV